MGNLYGNKLSTLGKFDLKYDYSNLALISIDNDDFPGIVQTYQIQRSERTQPVQCFNDSIHLYAFGKNPIQGNIGGFLLVESGFKKMIDKYNTKYRAYKGKATTIAFQSGETISAIVRDFIYSAVAERPVLVQFNMNFWGLDENDTFLVGKQ